MRNRIVVISALVVLISARNLTAGGAHHYCPDSLLNHVWSAYWIEVPHTPGNAFGVYLFRKSFDIRTVPDSFVVNVSADNRYKLYVNGTLVSLGPARGEVLHWRYETVDIAGSLHPGVNVVAALVWNDSDMRPEAQISYRTGFILQGGSERERVVNTDTTWKCIRNECYRQLTPRVMGYFAASPGEYVDMNQYPAGWDSLGYDDSSWQHASELFQGTPKGVFTYNPGWMLVPSNIPPMELKDQNLIRVRESSGTNVPDSFVGGTTPVTFPANTDSKFLLDQTFETDAYINVILSGGKGAEVHLTYAEAPYTESRKDSASSPVFYKTNRNDVAGKVFIGLQDEVVSNGFSNQNFQSLWWRAFRYIEVEVKTKDQPLTLDEIYGTYTGYPFRMNARFESPDTLLRQILDVGWHTARLCAFETYMDCPYYEELQYIGDTRIQALVSYYNSGDSRLARNAIELLGDSRIADGLTQSRYPTVTTQIIPTFSLWWIGMLHDYWMYTPDSDFVRRELVGARDILSFFNRYQNKDGSLSHLPYWVFTDWVDAAGWRDGMAPVGDDGSSSIVDMQLLWAYELAAQMEGRLGMRALASIYCRRVSELKETIRRKYWSESRGEFADTREMNTFSQHANALAILAGVVSGDQARNLGRKLLDDSTLTEATIYFKYYVNRALVESGYGDKYTDLLGIWKKNLQDGLTTWAEISDLRNNRSDCHAWGAGPNVELYRTVLGIGSGAPGFRKIIVAPHLGSMTWLKGYIPHPDGRVSADYSLDGDKWIVKVGIPGGTTGILSWEGKRYKLRPGLNKFIFRLQR